MNVDVDAGWRARRKAHEQKVEKFADLSPSRIDVASLGFS
jgi:hypothetical protein